MVHAARGGDDRAFGELYERYRTRIYAFVLGLVRDHGRAEDIAQDVFVSALRRLRSSEREISFKPWIYEIAKNACIDEFRRANRSREVPTEFDQGQNLLPAAPSPDRCFEQGQQLAALNGAFRGLSERQHKVLVMRELEGMSYADIAARTGMTVAMVQSTLLRARRRLSEEYGDIASGRRCEQVHAVVDIGGKSAFDSLGSRERRRFIRHIAHCQPCGRHARMAGINEPEARVPGIVKKLAGLLPFPFARWSLAWGGRGRHGHAVGRSARKAAQFVAHSGASVAAAPATVATVAVIVIAGGGTAVELLGPGANSRRPATAATAATPAAARRALPAAQRTTTVPISLASRSAAAGRPVQPSRSGAPGTARAGHMTGKASSGTQTGASPSVSAGGSKQSTQPSTPSAPSAPSAPVAAPSGPGVHVPSVPGPSLPPPLKKAVRNITNPVKKVLQRTLPNPLPPGLKDPLPPGLKDPLPPGLKDPLPPGSKDPLTQGLKHLVNGNGGL